MTEGLSVPIDQYKQLEQQKDALRAQLIKAYNITLSSVQGPKTASSPTSVDILTPVVSNAFDILEAVDRLEVLTALNHAQRDMDNLILHVDFDSRNSKYIFGAFVIAWGKYCDRTGRKGFGVELVDKNGTTIFTTKTN